MKYLLLLPIQLYWLLISPDKRNQCIFKENCSKHVYNVTVEEGILKGIAALWFRYKNCRGNYLIINTGEQTLLVTAAQFVLQEYEIREGLIEKRNSYEI